MHSDDREAQDMAGLGGEPLMEIFRRAASTDPAPGGGSVTALCGALGIALVLKALRISLRRRDDAERFAAADRALDQLAAQLTEDADADAGAYGRYIAALRLPKDRPDEAAARAARLQQASVEAVEVAIAALDHAAKAIGQAQALREAISSRLAPDLTAGIELLEVTRRNALQNARDNLAGVADEEAKSSLALRLDRLGER